MRLATILFAGTALSGTGCSYLIHDRRAITTVPKSSEEVRAQLGEPVASGVQDGVRYEQFESRQKYRDVDYTSMSYSMRMMVTAGLAELWYLPCELYFQSKRLAFGQHILVCYDGYGRIASFEVNRSGWRALTPTQAVIERVREWNEKDANKPEKPAVGAMFVTSRSR